MCTGAEMLTAVGEPKRSMSGCRNKKVVIREGVSCRASERLPASGSKRQKTQEVRVSHEAGDTCGGFQCYGAQISGVGDYCDPGTM